MKKLHIGYHKTGTSFLQQLIFPNCKDYKGKLYLENVLHNHKQYEIKGNDYETGRNILLNLENDWFISDEIYTRMKPKDLMSICYEFKPDKILIVKREFNDLLRSRKNHNSPPFYLNTKIQKNIIDDEVIYHYDFNRLYNDLSKISNVTMLNYEKIFNGDNTELSELSNFCEQDIKDLFMINIKNKINESK